MAKSQSHLPPQPFLAQFQVPKGSHKPPQYPPGTRSSNSGKTGGGGVTGAKIVSRHHNGPGYNDHYYNKKPYDDGLVYDYKYSNYRHDARNGMTGPNGKGKGKDSYAYGLRIKQCQHTEIITDYERDKAKDFSTVGDRHTADPSKQYAGSGEFCFQASDPWRYYRPSTSLDHQTWRRSEHSNNHSQAQSHDKQLMCQPQRGQSLFDRIQGCWLNSSSSSIEQGRICATYYQLQGCSCTEFHGEQSSSSRLILHEPDLYHYSKGLWYRLNSLSSDTNVSCLVWRQVLETDWRVDPSMKEVTWERVDHFCVDPSGGATRRRAICDNQPKDNIRPGNLLSQERADEPPEISPERTLELNKFRNGGVFSSLDTRTEILESDSDSINLRHADGLTLPVKRVIPEENKKIDSNCDNESTVTREHVNSDKDTKVDFGLSHLPNNNGASLMSCTDKKEQPSMSSRHCLIAEQIPNPLSSGCSSEHQPPSQGDFETLD